MTYGLSIWYTPCGEARHNKSQLAILETLQYKAQKTIRGAISATSKSALNIETYIPPIKIRLNRLVCESALRIAISPAYKDIIACRSQRRVRVKSNLETLLNYIEKKTKVKPKTVEPSCAYLTQAILKQCAHISIVECRTPRMMVVGYDGTLFQDV